MTNKPTACREYCGACCIAPSISTPIPGMPQGKPAGIACIHLDDMMRCKLFGLSRRPAVCSRIQPEPEMCGKQRQDALDYLSWLEKMTLSQ